MTTHKWEDVRGWGGLPSGTLQCDHCNRVVTPNDPDREAKMSKPCEVTR